MAENVKFFHIAVLGPQGAGKTVFISSVFWAFTKLPNKGIASSFPNPFKEKEIKGQIPQELQTNLMSEEEKSTQEIIYENLKNLFERQNFSEISGTKRNWNLVILLQSHNEEKAVVFYDIPGGWFQDEETWNDKINDNGIQKRMEFCDAAFLIIDAPQLLKSEIEYGRNIETFIRALDEIYKKKSSTLPVAIVFSKCDDPRVKNVSLEQLQEKVQGVINTLSVKGKTETELNKRFFKMQQYKCFKVSAIGELIDGKPPYGGPIKNELFFNLQDSFKFILEYKKKASQEKWNKIKELLLNKAFIFASIIVLLIISIVSIFILRHQWNSKAEELEKSIEVLTVFDSYKKLDGFLKEKCPWLHDKDLLTKLKVSKITKGNKIASEFLNNLSNKYSEPENKLLLPLAEYQAWQKEIDEYSIIFEECDHQEALKKLSHFKNIVKWKIFGRQLIEQSSKNLNFQEIVSLSQEWDKLKLNVPALQEVVDAHTIVLEQRQIVPIINELNKRIFPEPFASEFNTTLSQYSWKKSQQEKLMEILEKKWLSKKQELLESKKFTLAFEMNNLLKRDLPLQHILNDIVLKDWIVKKEHELKQEYHQLEKQYWDSLKVKYIEEDSNQITLSHKQYQTWKEDLIFYLNVFSIDTVYKEEESKNILLVLNRKLEIVSLLEEYQKIKDTSEDLQVEKYQSLLQKWQKIDNNDLKYNKTILENIELLKKQLNGILIKSLPVKEFPEPFLSTLSKFLKVDVSQEFNYDIFLLLKNHVSETMRKYIENKEYQEAIRLLQELENKLPGEVKISKQNITLQEWLDSENANIKKDYDEYDYEKVKQYLETSALESDQIQRCQNHQKLFQKVCIHLKLLDNQIYRLKKQREQKEYQSIYNWFLGNPKDYDGLIEQIDRLQKNIPDVDDKIIEGLETLKKKTRNEILLADFKEIEKNSELFQSSHQYQKAQEEVYTFIQRWSLKYSIYPEAESFVDKANLLLKEIKFDYRKNDYREIYKNFLKINTMVALEECLKECNSFKKLHGYDKDVDIAMAFLQSIANPVTYTITLISGKHLTNWILVANLTVSVSINGNLVHTSEEYDDNAPTWNEKFDITWSAFDKIEVK